MTEETDAPECPSCGGPMPEGYEVCPNCESWRQARQENRARGNILDRLHEGEK